MRDEYGQLCLQTLRWFITFYLLILFGFTYCYAQDPVFGEDNDVYIDAPAVGNEGAVVAGQGLAPRESLHQFQTGYLNLQFNDPVYYQFSGNDIFASGSLPNSFLLTGGGNLAWSQIIPFDWEYVPGVAYGADIMYYYSTSSDAYGGSGTVAGPIINMHLVFAGVNVKAYFMDPFKPLIHPYIGLGWGVIAGHANTITESAVEYSTNISGLQTYRSLGMEVQLSQQAGLIIEARMQSGDASASNDPFDQAASGESLLLELDGVMIGISGMYRF